MKLRFTKKDKKTSKFSASHCFNCGHPFFGSEKFCPECGQANKDPKITFGSFVYEIFNGFISWDSKFWNTLIPLLSKPGKVSKEYMDGKRMRYANPFRFYISVSVIFFLVVGATKSYDTFNNLRKGTSVSTRSINAKIDSIKRTIDINSKPFQKELNTALQAIDSGEKKESLTAVTTLDENLQKKKKNTTFHMSFFPNANAFFNFQKEHPNVDSESALDSLKATHTFMNRFMYSRFQAVQKITENKESEKQFIKQLISYTSIALIVLLPVFTIFFKLFYIRSKHTYVSHLVFVFHVQTVFFLLLTLFYLANYFNGKEFIIPLFLLLFLIYLYLAMKRFYEQSPLKTFMKYALVNTSFFLIATFGSLLVGLLAFAMY